MSNAKKIKIAVTFVFVFMAAYALSMGMYATLLPHIIDFYGTNFKEASWFNIANDIGNLAAMGFIMLVADRINKNKLLGIMTVLLGGIMVLIGMAPVIIIFLLMRVFLGMTGSIVDNLCAAYVSDLYGEDRSRYISILHMIYAIGSLLGPQYAYYMVTSGGGWNVNYMVLGIVTVAASALFLIVMFIIKEPKPLVANTDAKGKNKKIPYLDILREHNMIVLCVAGFLLSGSIYFCTWLPTYLSNLNPQVYTDGVRSMIMTLYSMGMILSRMIYAAISRKLSPDRYLKFSSLTSVLVLTIALFVQNVTMWYVAIFLFGLIGGTGYTAKFILACSEFPEYSATAMAMTGVTAALGSISFSLIGGAVADAGNFTLAMFIPLMAYVCVSLLFFFAYRPKTQA